MDPKTAFKAFRTKFKKVARKLAVALVVVGTAGALFVYARPNLPRYLKSGREGLNRAPAAIKRSFDKIRTAWNAQLKELKGLQGEAKKAQAKIDAKKKHEEQAKLLAEKKAAKLRGHRPASLAAADESVSSEPGLISQLFETYGGALLSAQRKVEEIRAYEYDNERLRLENANLRLWAESMQLDCRVKEGAQRTHAAESRVLTETGTRTGRTLASIHYRPPAHLLPGQLHTLGVSYFKGREDEKAAVILTFLTELEDNDSFKNARDYVLTGVAWYRLGNLKLADEYFTRALKTAVSEAALPYQAQARLWRGIVAERGGKHLKSQFWLRELVDHHPYSTEARWINAKGSYKAAVKPDGEIDEEELSRRTLAAEAKKPEADPKAKDKEDHANEHHQEAH